MIHPSSYRDLERGEARGSSGASSPDAALAGSHMGFTISEHCSLWYFLRVVKSACRGNVFISLTDTFREHRCALGPEECLHTQNVSFIPTLSIGLIKDLTSTWPGHDLGVCWSWSIPPLHPPVLPSPSPKDLTAREPSLQHIRQLPGFSFNTCSKHSAPWMY